ncbi:MAG TPA: serine hydrolase domain-containing protein [bacterium]|nr:serine hydrolase domain-containing protein [bacterium]
MIKEGNTVTHQKSRWSIMPNTPVGLLRSSPRSVRRRAGTPLQDALRVVAAWLDYKRTYHRIPALSVGVVHGNDMVFRAAYGYADEAARRKPTDRTCYRVASISKTFTATAVMQLVERGLVRLDERADYYVPWFKSRRGGSLDAITVRHLLSHGAGVERDGSDHWTTDRFPTLEQLKARVRDGVAVFPPLERWKYSNLGYAVLGQVVAAAGGRSYEDCVRAGILEPLGLTHSGFDLTPKIIQSLALGYGREGPGRGRAPFTHPDTNVWRAAAGMVSNVVDLCAFMSAQFPGSGRLLSDLSKREMRRPQWQRAGEGYGLGYHIWTVDCTPIVGHGGGFQGFKTAIGMDTERKIGVAVLTNAIDGPAQPLMIGIFQTIYDCLGRVDSRASSSATSAALLRYEGRYTNRWGELEIVRVGNRLVGFEPRSDRPLRDVDELERRGPGRFRIVAGAGIGSIGEAVTFQLDARGVPRRLRWGPTPMRRVKTNRQS